MLRIKVKKMKEERAGQQPILLIFEIKYKLCCRIEQCRKTTVLSCHRCLLNTGVENISNVLR